MGARAPASAFVRGPVLVTGASGFVGRHLVAELAASGWCVRAVGGRRPVPAASANVVVMRGRGLGAQTDWSDALVGADAVVHLAGSAHGRDGGDPVRMQEVNEAGAMRLAECAAAAGVRRFVLVSSIGVHGNASRGAPFTEDSPLRPEAAYATTKLAGEVGARDALIESSCELVILRPPLVYGPAAPGNPARLLKWVRRGWPLPLASVRNRRSFVSVLNLCAAIAVCLDDARAAGETFLVADRETISTPELLSEIALRLGRPFRQLPCPPALLSFCAAFAGRREDMMRLASDLVVDASKLEACLGFEPPLSLAEGLDHWIGADG